MRHRSTGSCGSSGGAEDLLVSERIRSLVIDEIGPQRLIDSAVHADDR